MKAETKSLFFNPKEVYFLALSISLGPVYSFDHVSSPLVITNPQLVCPQVGWYKLRDEFLPNL